MSSILINTKISTCYQLVLAVHFLVFNLFLFQTDAGILPTLQDCTPFPIFVVLAGMHLVSCVVQTRARLFFNSEEVNTKFI